MNSIASYLRYAGVTAKSSSKNTQSTYVQSSPFESVSEDITETYMQPASTSSPPQAIHQQSNKSSHNAIVSTSVTTASTTTCTQSSYSHKKQDVQLSHIQIKNPNSRYLKQDKKDVLSNKNIMFAQAAASGRETQARQMMKMQVATGAYQYNAPVATTQKVETATLIGRVTKVSKTFGTNRNGSVFWVYTASMKKEFKCVTDFFCKVAEGDSLQATVEMEKNGRGDITLRMRQMPFIQPAVDKNTIIRCWVSILAKAKTRFGNTKASQLFYKLAEQARSADNVDKYRRDYARDTKNAGVVTNAITEEDEDAILVSAYISEMAGLWSQTENMEIIDLLTYKNIISEKQVKILLRKWHKDRNLRRLWMFGLYNDEIKACNMPWEEIYERCITNPYTLVPITMAKAADIMRIQGKQATQTQLYCAQVARKMYSNMMNKSWTCTPIIEIASQFPNIEQHLQELVTDYCLKSEYNSLYLKYPFEVERSVAKWMAKIIKKPPIETMPDAIFSSKYLSDEQRSAVQGALSNHVSVINGGAGTGKTKVIGEILYNLENLDISYQVTSFTGKAVAHIRTALNRNNPATMDKLISQASRVSEFDVLIIDEISMVTVELMFRFIRQFTHEFRIVFVGDQNQLQPIGWGSLFTELLKTNIVPTFTLTKNFRADVVGIRCGIVENSCGIVTAANNKTSFQFVQTNNFSIFPGYVDNVRDAMTGLRRNGVTKHNLTVLCPYNKPLLELNSHYTDIFVPQSREQWDSRNIRWRLGDRVMMKDNDYDINIMNGEEGEVTDINIEEVLVTFKDGAQHPFKLKIPDKSWDSKDASRQKILSCKDIQHAGAMTIHKSQGSEWDYVIVYVPNGGNSSQSDFLNSNLLYTGITRSRKMCVIIGDETFLNIIAMHDSPHRQEHFADCLHDLI